MKKTVIKGLLLAASICSTFTAANATTSKFINAGDLTSAPIGHVRYCQHNPGTTECNFRQNNPRVMGLTEARWNELLHINDRVNRDVAPVTDMDLYKVVEHWTMPNGAGDCEDYVLLKRHILISKGWPPEALLITVVRDTNGEGHAILTVRTDYGEFVLDNQVAAVLPWDQTRYKFIKRQSEFNLAQWRTVHDHRFSSLAQLN